MILTPDNPNDPIEKSILAALNGAVMRRITAKNDKTRANAARLVAQYERELEWYRSIGKVGDKPQAPR